MDQLHLHPAREARNRVLAKEKIASRQKGTCGGGSLSKTRKSVQAGWQAIARVSPHHAAAITSHLPVCSWPG